MSNILGMSYEARNNVRVTEYNATAAHRAAQAEAIRAAKAEGKPWETDAEVKSMTREEATFKIDNLRKQHSLNDLCGGDLYLTARNTRLEWAKRNGKAEASLYTECTDCQGEGEVEDEYGAVPCGRCYGEGSTRK